MNKREDYRTVQNMSEAMSYAYNCVKTYYAILDSYKDKPADKTDPTDMAIYYDVMGQAGDFAKVFPSPIDAIKRLGFISDRLSVAFREFGYEGDEIAVMDPFYTKGRTHDAYDVIHVISKLKGYMKEQVKEGLRLMRRCEWYVPTEFILDFDYALGAMAALADMMGDLK